MDGATSTVARSLIDSAPHGARILSDHRYGSLPLVENVGFIILYQLAPHSRLGALGAAKRGALAASQDGDSLRNARA